MYHFPSVCSVAKLSLTSLEVSKYNISADCSPPSLFLQQELSVYALLEKSKSIVGSATRTGSHNHILQALWITRCECSHISHGRLILRFSFVGKGTEKGGRQARVYRRSDGKESRSYWRFSCPHWVTCNKKTKRCFDNLWWIQINLRSSECLWVLLDYHPALGTGFKYIPSDTTVLAQENNPDSISKSCYKMSFQRKLNAGKAPHYVLLMSI